MERRYYDAAALEKTLASLEEHFEMTSAEFYDEQDREKIARIPGRIRNLWASLYRDWRRLSGQDFIERVEHEIEYA